MTFQNFPTPKNYITRNDEPLSPFELPILYPYALLVFHKIDSLYPHPLPIFALTLEISYLTGPFGNIDDMDFNPDAPDLDRPGSWSPVFFCMFQENRHYNFGFYNHELGIDAVRENFFKKLNSLLYLKTKPRKAGKMLSAFGHPETGLPSRY